MVSLTWVRDGVDGRWVSATLPGSCLLMGVRDTGLMPMASVAGGSDLVDTSYYWYEELTRKITMLRSTAEGTTPPIFVDLLYREPRLLISEISNAETAGTVRTRYANPQSVVVTHGYSSFSVPSSGVSNNLVAFTLPSVRKGYWVRVDYYVPNSFTIYGARELHTYAASASNLWVIYETAPPNTRRSITLSGPLSGALQFNPILGGTRSGYIFGTNTSIPSAIWGAPSRVEVLISRSSDACPAQETYVRFVARCYDSRERPIPFLPSSISLSPGASAVAVYPSVSYFDGRGEIQGLLSTRASSGETFGLWIQVSCLGVVGSALATVYSAGTRLSFLKYWIGKQFGYIDPHTNGLGGHDLYLYATSLDGIRHRTTGTGYGTTLLTKSGGTFLEYDGTPTSLGTVKTGGPPYSDTPAGYMGSVRLTYIPPKAEDYLAMFKTEANSSLQILAAPSKIIRVPVQEVS